MACEWLDGEALLHKLLNQEAIFKIFTAKKDHSSLLRQILSLEKKHLLTLNYRSNTPAKSILVKHCQ